MNGVMCFSSTSRYNKVVRRTILRKVQQAGDYADGQVIGKYSCLLFTIDKMFASVYLKAAIQRKYENMRRRWLTEGKDNYAEFCDRESLKRKSVSVDKGCV